MFKDPICGMKVSEDSLFKTMEHNQTVYFCSAACLKKYSQQHQHKTNESCCEESSQKSFYKNKIFILAVGIVIACLISYVLPTLVPFRESFFMYFEKAWWAILLGLVIGGAIDHYIPQEYISYFLARRQKRTIFYSVSLGALMSVCNHGILAISMQLYKKGAATSAVVAFLLASPWANLPLTLMLVSFFGLVKALYIVMSAVIIALITGLIYQVFEHYQWVEVNLRTVEVNHNFSIKEDMQKRFKEATFSSKDIKAVGEGMASLSNMVLWWTLLGVVIASAVAAYVPSDLLKNYMGPTVLGLCVTLLAATIIEVCSEGMSPLAFEIYRQTGALGNSLVFLMAGVATDYTEIGLIWQNVGKKAAIWLPIITIPQIIFWGVLANIIF